LTFVLTQESAAAFSREWIDAWNSHDLDRILSHYSDDFDMRSPLIRERMFDQSGVLRGKENIRSYWGKALQAIPPIRFELAGFHIGAASLAIHYRSIGRGLVTEVVIFDNNGKVISGNAMYGTKESAQIT
jgi:hypothetical protein